MNPLLLRLILRLAGAVGLMAALAAGYFLWADHQQNIGAKREIEVCNVATIKQKAVAATVLAKAMTEAATAQAALSALIAKLEKEREISQAKNDADLRRRRAGPRLQFPAPAGNAGSCGGAAQGTAPAATSDASPSYIQLPEPINGNLLDFAADAESLAIDYRVLYLYVNNPALACELRTTP